MTSILSRISTFGQGNQNIRNLFGTQSDINDLTYQATTGIKARQYSGVASGSNLLVNLEQSLLRADTYRDNIATAKRRLQQQEQNTAQITDMATEFKKTLLSAANAENADDIPLASLARSFFDQVASFLNQSQDERYIFGGTQTDRPPVASFDTIRTNLRTEVSRGKVLDTTNLAPEGMTINGNVATQGSPLRVAQVIDYFLQDSEYNSLTGGKAAVPGQSPITPPYLTGATTTFNQANFNGQTGLGDLATNYHTAFTANAPGAGNYFDIQFVDGAGNVLGTVSPTNAAVNGQNLAGIATAIDGLAGVTASTVTDASGTRIVFGHDGAAPAGTVGVRVTNVTADAQALGITGGPNRQYLDFKSLFYQGTQVQNTARIEDGKDIDYGALANQSAYEKLLLAGFMLADGGGEGSGAIDLNGTGAVGGSIDRATRIEAAIKLVSDAIADNTEDALTTVRAQIGVSIKQLDNTVKRHDAYEIASEEVIVGIEGVDQAEVAVLLSQKRLVLETSYAAIASISQLSLAQYLR